MKTIQAWLTNLHGFAHLNGALGLNKDFATDISITDIPRAVFMTREVISVLSILHFNEL